MSKLVYLIYRFMFVNLATNPFGNYVIKRVLISGD